MNAKTTTSFTFMTHLNERCLRAERCSNIARSRRNTLTLTLFAPSQLFKRLIDRECPDCPAQVDSSRRPILTLDYVSPSLSSLTSTSMSISVFGQFGTPFQSQLKAHSRKNGLPSSTYCSSFG